MLSLPRNAIAVLLAVVLVLPKKGATYEGIAGVLGLRSYSGVRHAVHAAKVADLVHVVSGRGRYGRAVIYPTRRARKLLEKSGLEFPRVSED